MSDPVRLRPEAIRAKWRNVPVLLDRMWKHLEDVEPEVAPTARQVSEDVELIVRAAEADITELTLQVDALRQQLAEAEAANEELIKQGLELGEELIAAEAERERLKAALEEIIQADNTPYEHLAEIARAALLTAHPEQP